MARPVKYQSDEDRANAAQLSAAVIKEIKQSSGLAYPALSDFLARHRIIISDAMLRQYACARKPIGSRRLTELAELAYAEGWAGEKCMEVLLFHNYDHFNNIKAIQKDFGKYSKLLEKRILLCVKDMLAAGYSESQILLIVKRILQQEF